MPAAVTFVRATLNDSDTLNAAAFNALTAPSATVPDVVPGTTAGVMPATTTVAGLALTNAADAAAQRTALGLVIGTNVQAYTADLAAIAGLTGAADRLPYFTGPGAAALATFTSYGRTLAALVDAAAGRTALGLATMALQAASGVAITGGAINGTPIGAVTPSTVAATALGLGNFSVTAASASVLRFAGNQAFNALQGFDGTNAYGVTLFNGAAANVVIQSNGASSFAGGINSTPIGTGGASTGAFTTVSASSGATALAITANSTSANGTYVQINNSGTANTFLGAWRALLGAGNATDTVLLSSGATLGLGVNSGTNVPLSISSTGLAVTGALSATGIITTATQVTSSGSNPLRLQCPTNTSVTIGVDGGSQLVVAGYSPATFSQGLAVTGTLSATGEIASFGSSGGVNNRLKASYNSGSGVAVFGPDSNGGTTSLNIGVSNAGTYNTVLGISTTGLAVTGALSSTGTGTFGATTNSAGVAIPSYGTSALVINSTGIAADSSLRINRGSGTYWLISHDSQGGLTFNRDNTDKAFFGRNGVDGLSVTGALSSTTGANFATSSGNVVIGNATATAKLHIQADFSSSYGATVRTTSNASDANLIQFVKDAAGSPNQVGNITYTNATNLTNYNTASDARLKDNVRELTNSGNIIDGLRPVLHDWKTGQKNIIGFIAQEVFAVFPQAVSKGDDDLETVTQQWSMDASKLVPVLTAELKSLRARVAHLEAA